MFTAAFPSLIVPERFEQSFPLIRSSVDEEISVGGPHHTEGRVLPDVVDHPHPLQIFSISLFYQVGLG